MPNHRCDGRMRISARVVQMLEEKEGKKKKIDIVMYRNEEEILGCENPEGCRPLGW